jgi:outer membrane protein TolC
VRQNDAEEVQSYLGTVGFAIPLWDRGKNSRTAAKARLQQAESERDLADRAFAGEVARLSGELNLRWQEQNRYGKILIPLLEQHAEQAEESYREGFIGYLEYLDARTALREGQLAYIKALKEYHVAYQTVYSLVEMDADKEIENEK